ncbi:MAG: NAD-dependent epimerase/dehydratase family protein, partial [Patescibacteria group bacterium]
MNSLAEIIIKDAEKILEKVDLSELEGKSILITGASGLIGTYFLVCLKVFSEKKKIGKITAISNSKYPVYLNDLINYPEIEIIEGDLTNYEFLQKMPMADYIIHAAGYGQPGRFMENPIKTLKLNTETTFCLFDKLKKDGKLLFLSTSEVYSGLTTPPHKESEIGSTNTNHPRSCYIEAKRCGEAICNAYRTKGFRAKSARISLTYGPGTKPNDLRAINSFIQKAIQGRIELLDQ